MHRTKTTGYCLQTNWYYGSENTLEKQCHVQDFLQNYPTLTYPKKTLKLFSRWLTI